MFSRSENVKSRPLPREGQQQAAVQRAFLLIEMLMGSSIPIVQADVNKGKTFTHA